MPDISTLKTLPALETLPDLTAYISNGFTILFYFVLLIFTFYTLFLAYHWFAYGTKKTTAMLILAIYLLGSAPFILIMSISL